MGNETIRMRYGELFQSVRRKTHAKHVTVRWIWRRSKKQLLFFFFSSAEKRDMQKGHVMMERWDASVGHTCSVRGQFVQSHSVLCHGLLKITAII